MIEYAFDYLYYILSIKKAHESFFNWKNKIKIFIDILIHDKIKAIE